MLSYREVEQRWRKSSRSLNDGNCIEVTFDRAHLFVRDSQDPHGWTLMFERQPWRSFVSSLKTGLFVGSE